MLDAKDITNVCGVISKNDVLKEISNYDLINILKDSDKYLFRGMYVLVEEEFVDHQEYAEAKFFDGIHNDYYVNTKGEIFAVSHATGKKKFLKKRIYNNCAYVKVSGKGQVQVKNLVARHFLKTKPHQVVMNENGNLYDCRVKNLVILSKQECGKLTGGKNNKPVGLYDNRKIVKRWKSAKECAAALYCSDHTIRNICNKVTKKPMYDLRWLKNGR